MQNGFIALWKDGRAEPLKVFPYRAELLPEQDQQALEKGIRFESREELLAMLEDYLS